MNQLKNVEYIIIHHSQRQLDFPFFMKLRHKYFRKWKDIGYHYLIGNNRLFTKDGKLYTGRSEAFEGAHAIGHNDSSLGICLIGNFDKSPPSEKQLNTLHSLLEEKTKQYNIPIENTLGHNELPGVTKSCPGQFTDMNEIRNRLYIK